MMNYFFSNLLIAMGLVFTPEPVWSLYGINTEFKVEVDTSSLVVKQVDGAWEISSLFKFTPTEPVSVKGKTKKGVYYIDAITARCRNDKLMLDEITLYAADGTALETGKNLGEISNPRLEGHFVTDYLTTMCNAAESKKLMPRRKSGLIV